MTTNGFFTEKRGGYMIPNVNSAEEVAELLGPMLEFFHLKVHPVMPLEKVPELFGKYLAL